MVLELNMVKLLQMTHMDPDTKVTILMEFITAKEDSQDMIEFWKVNSKMANL